MNALDGGPHGVTEAAAANTVALAYRATADHAGGVSSYCLSVLKSIAEDDLPVKGESLQHYAERHLAVLQKIGYIEQTEVSA